MKWIYYIWSFGFTSGRVYGNKGAGWNDEKPLYIADLKRTLAALKKDRSNAAKFFLEYLEKAIKKAEKE